MKHLVQVSGGIDSAAALCRAIEAGGEVWGIFYNWGQKYRLQELVAARQLMYRLKLTLIERDIPLGVDKQFPVPEYIPYRNLVLVAHSLNFASAYHFNTVVVGCKSEAVREDDPYSFRDSTFSPFVTQMNDFVKVLTEPKAFQPRVVMPLAGWSKVKVVTYLKHSGIDPDTLWTCYESGPMPCGKCYHCQEYEKAKSEVLEAGRV